MTQDTTIQKAISAFDQILDDLSAGTMKFPGHGVCEQAWNEAVGAVALLRNAQDGWRLVPIEPTEKMQAALVSAVTDGITINDDIHRTARHAYRAMLAAVPAPGAGVE